VRIGLHVRIGLEDHHYAEQGKLTNPQIAERASATINAMGHEVTSPDEAREILKYSLAPPYRS
jgi:3-keto-5-aminohexanoate cleavage enzyme